jgi:hypothetical protein
MKNKYYKRALVFGLSLSLLPGCQTPIEHAGNEHRLVVDKWRELSKYAESELVKYKFLVNAKLTLIKDEDEDEVEDEVEVEDEDEVEDEVEDEDEVEYQLTDITLSASENNFNINLLWPSFNNKYVCSPVCKQLVEYTNTKEKEGSTLLDQFFTKHEFEFFKFYGELYHLNWQIIELESIQIDSVELFLSSIVNKKQNFATLSEFSQYLTENITADAFTKFINDPLSTLYNEDDEIELIDETALWLTNSTDSIIKPIKPIKPIKKDSQVVQHQANNVGDKVCTYQQNTYGNIISIKGQNAAVMVIGQAKQFTDGIIGDYDDGYLFYEHTQDIRFIPVKKMSILPLINLFMCDHKKYL